MASACAWSPPRLRTVRGKHSRLPYALIFRLWLFESAHAEWKPWDVPEDYKVEHTAYANNLPTPKP